MCLGIPGRIVSAPAGSTHGQVEVAGVLREINLELLERPVRPGEYVLIHSGFALERMSAAQAADALAIFGAEP